MKNELQLHSLEDLEKHLSLDVTAEAETGFLVVSASGFLVV